jgi:hypothetical protein
MSPKPTEATLTAAARRLLPDAIVVQLQRYWPLLFLAPFFFGLAAKLTRDIHEFIDMETIVCAGRNVLLGISPYVTPHDCPNMGPAAFVYPPITAQISALVQRKISITGIMMFYGFLYFAMFILLIRLAIRRDEGLVWRAPLLLSISASGLLSGNVSLILHGIIFLIVWQFTLIPWLLLPAIVASAIIKPEFVVYAGLFVFVGRGFFRQIAKGLVTIAAAFGVLFLNYLTNRDIFLQWFDRLLAVRSVFVQGHGIMVVLELLGIQSPVGELALYVPFVAVLFAAALTVRHGCRLSPRDSALFGIAICLLAYPRLLDYDEYTLPFGLAVLAAPFARAELFSRRNFQLLFLAGCLTFTAFGGIRGGVILFLLSLAMLFTLAAKLALAGRASLLGPRGAA